MSSTDLPDAGRLERQTDEGAQEGPQHPSTHGVLRIMMELDGETVLRVKPVVGYLHTGMEKTGEELTYVQGSTNVTRMDYASPLSNELVFSMAVERLLDVELPLRATWIRMLLVELNRMASHLLFQATNGMDLGALSMMVYGWREREDTLRLLEEITGLRMNHNFIRPGGVAADLPDGWEEATLAVCESVERGVGEFDELLTQNPIWLERMVGVGVITTEQAIALGASGPILRSTGFPWDLRKAQPYLHYDEVDFDIIYTQNGDCFDRYRIRLYEILESVKIVRQCVEKMPPGDYRVQDRKVTPPPRARIDESMEALIHHFKLFTEGFKVPPGETYVAVESPRGEIGCYLVSDGTGKPVRLHIRGPSFYNLQSAGPMAEGSLVADAVAIVSSVDPIMGEVDR
jgi:NADH-quinone oxidoreductase subunit D